MKGSKNNWPPVPGGSAEPGYGSDHGESGAGGAKNLRVRSGYHKKQLYLATYNTRTLRTDAKLIELEKAIGKLRWDIIGLSEVRRQGEDSIILDSGNLLYYREGDKQSFGGVGFIIHKSLVNNVLTIGSVSTRIAFLILKISEKHSLNIIQVYAPTSAYPKAVVKTMYEDITKAMHVFETQYTVVMGDFNARLGTRCDNELGVGEFGVGKRNARGHMLAAFMKKENLFMVNSFFRKSKRWKWTWISPDGKVKNEIDFIMSTKKDIFKDVSVISDVNVGSDHRMLRGTLNIRIKLERSRLTACTLRPVRAQIQNTDNSSFTNFQLHLQNCFKPLQNSVDVDDIKNSEVDSVHIDESIIIQKQPP
jgi:endonuclease/exonuclease/phosphatase family metal-dependent hydrolase